MKKNFKITLVGALALFVLAGCALAPSGEAESGGAASSTEPVLVSGATKSAGSKTDTVDTADAENESSSFEVDFSVSGRDASGEYDAAGAVTLSPGDDLTITEAGVYILSGTYEDQMILIEAGEEDKVQLVLDNAVITNSSGPAICVLSADKVFITAAEGTVNTISDGADYTLADGETEPDAAVYSREDLTINGSGKLTISGNYKHAVVSKDDLVVTAKDLSVEAKNVGLSGKDSVTISSASVSITAGTDGIRSENGTDSAKGYVAVADSSVTISSGRDGIQAETVFAAQNAEISIKAGGGSAGESESCKGVKAGVAVTISSGHYQIDALDDAVHTNGTILISGGEFTLESRDDGVHADEKIEISGGKLDITACEGVEATKVVVSGGEITIAATDDGINATRKCAGLNPSVEISGGTITITMGAGDTDGIDVNGDIAITGGTVYVNGNSSFDYDGTATFTGGTVIVNGQQVTTIPNQFMGGGMGGFGGQGGTGGFGGGPGGQGGFGGGPGGRHG